MFKKICAASVFSKITRVKTVERVRCGANGGTVALDCKSAVSTSRSTILPGNNHQHPRSSSLNTRKPKQKLMSKRRDKGKKLCRQKRRKRSGSINSSSTKNSEKVPVEEMSI